MGKKVKKDEKGPPDDQFDTLLVESRQAGTVVLMLNSPEEDVVAKACESIYKFVDKADENKKLLLDLGAVESLLQLIQHEERIIRRNACMALGVMTVHPEVRRSLRKKEESIPSFVNLLKPEEDTVVHEFAALGLCHMSTEFSSKVNIYKQNGLEALIGCLSSNDPDVQKNSIEAITLLLQEYQCKAAIRDLGGFSLILDLLESDYAIIQQLSLTALHEASEDVDNRVALRENGGVNKLIDFIGHPEWNDLHVYAVLVLSNCLEDVESVQLIKENGGLMKLVAYITDTTAPEDEDNKKGGKKDKAASRAGKKGKDDDDKKGKGGGGGVSTGGGGGDDGVTPTLPEVKEHAAKAIARSAKNADNRKILHEQDIEKMLITLLSHDDNGVQVAAAQGLAVMAESMASRDTIGKAEGIEALMKLVKSDVSEIKEAATLALTNLTTSNSYNASEVLRLKGVEPLIDLLSDNHERVQSNSASILTNLSTDEQFRNEIQKLGIIQALIEPLKSKSTLVQSKSAMAVAAYVCDAEWRTVFRENGGIETLVELLSTTDDDVRRSASWAITACAVDQPTATEICRHGGLDVLREIQLSSTRKNAFTEVALNKILSNDLSVKYSLYGNLSACDIINDGFFDAGQLCPGARLLTLEEHCAMDLNQRRPIIYVNAKPEKVEAPLFLEDQKDTQGKNRKAARKTRAVKLEKDSSKEDDGTKQDVEQSDGGFTPPGDSMLIQYINEVTENIQPLPTTKDQVVALARYVADKMGGAIDYGQLSNFSWELGLSEIKYELKSNVIPIGMIRAGIHYHRALLFKVLCDRIAVLTSLNRGEYNRAWNVVMVTEERDNPGAPKMPPKEFLVDLIYQPGMLIRMDTPEALNYQKI